MPCIWLKHLATAFRAKGFLTNPTVNRFGIGQSGRFRSKRSEEHTSELQSQSNLVCRLLLEKTINDEVVSLDTALAQSVVIMVSSALVRSCAKLLDRRHSFNPRAIAARGSASLHHANSHSEP